MFAHSRLPLSAQRANIKDIPPTLPTSTTSIFFQLFTPSRPLNTYPSHSINPFYQFTHILLNHPSCRASSTRSRRLCTTTRTRPLLLAPLPTELLLTALPILALLTVLLIPPLLTALLIPPLPTALPLPALTTQMQPTRPILELTLTLVRCVIGS